METSNWEINSYLGNVLFMERDEITMIVANNIKTRMLSKGLDAAKLARLSNLNPTGIYDILSGKSRSPKIETIAKIAKGLGVPLSAMFDELDEDDLKTEILYVFESLQSDADRERLVQTARAWLPETEAN